MRLNIAHRPENTQDVQTAYRELTQEAFAAWIVLCAAGGWFKGRRLVSEHLGLGYRRTNGICRELFHKGYMEIETEPGVAKKTTLKICTAARFDRSAIVVRL
jgi:hypothetical protein